MVNNADWLDAGDPRRRIEKLARLLHGRRSAASLCPVTAERDSRKRPGRADSCFWSGAPKKMRMRTGLSLSKAAVLLTIMTNYGGIKVNTVGDLGKLPTSLPAFLIPSVPFTLETLKIVFPYSLTMAAVGLLESMMTAQIVDDLTNTPMSRLSVSTRPAPRWSNASLSTTIWLPNQRWAHIEGETMDHILACIDSSAYTASVCDLAAWAPNGSIVRSNCSMSFSARIRSPDGTIFRAPLVLA